MRVHTPSWATRGGTYPWIRYWVDAVLYLVLFLECDSKHKLLSHSLELNGVNILKFCFSDYVFRRFIFIIYNFVCLLRRYVWFTIHESQKASLDFLELELQVVVNYLMEVTNLNLDPGI